MTERYLIALGSNRRHPRYGDPRGVLRAAVAALGDSNDMTVLAASPFIASAPLGPSRRRYANAAAIVATGRDPASLLELLKRTERRFGRRPGGERWQARVLDLDIILRDSGAWASPGLIVPHIAFRERPFVLHPAAVIAPRWRDPVTGLSIRHLSARLTRRNPLPIAAPGGALSSVGRATDF